MQNDTLRRATGLLTRTRRRIAWKRVVSFLACIVVFCTTYALILPALTIEETIYCGMESHRHSEKCYEKVLICGQEEGEITAHTHTEDCVTTERKLICNNEDPQHRHTDECYETIETYTCGMEEGKSTGHVHTDECYDSVLVCAIEEHAHELICYSNPTTNLETPGVWMNSLSGVTLSGNSHKDLIEVAKSQLGYEESSLNYDVAEDGTTKKGYTRYGAWYGDPYGDWSAMFVSFCLYYANIPTEYCPQEADCSVLMDKLQSDEYGFYVDAAEGYKPLAGDLVFFDEDGDGSSDHVGMVAEMLENRKGEFTKIKTIQGDVDDRVKYVTYPIKDETISGYAKLPNITRELNGDGQSQTYWGAGYSITVAYEADTFATGLAELRVNEYAQDSEYYEQHYNEAAEKFGWKAGETKDARLFDIRFFVGDAEQVPTKAVNVTITYYNEVAQSYDVILFGQAVNKLSSESAYENGEQKIKFSSAFLGDIMTVVTEGAETPPGTVPGIAPNGTVIHLFDYWIEDDRFAVDSAESQGVWNKPDNGINEGNVLKFTDGSGNGSTNKWTGGGALPRMVEIDQNGNVVPKEPQEPGGHEGREGLVELKLGDDGYPRLTKTAFAESMNGIDFDEQKASLAYLFDPKAVNSHKASFRNVTGLLQDKDGYHYYNSKENYAEFNEETHKFTLYDTWGVKDHNSKEHLNGQFFPFNKFSDVKDVLSTNPKMNHYFGLSMTCRFVQRYGGHTSIAEEAKATVFEFSGDDDVWVFIDGVLIGDLGGIHDAAKLSIDFSTGKVVISVVDNDDNDANDTKVVTSLEQMFQAAGEVISVDTGWKQTPEGDWIFADNTFHTLKFFYMERGNYASNMMLKYNLTPVPETEIRKVDQYGRRIPGVEFEVYRSEYQANTSDWPLLNSDGTTPAPSTTPSPAYKGTTDENGAMVFVDEDGMPYTIKELHDKFGEYCVLVETKVPEGFRRVSSKICLHVTDRSLWCENSYDSGVWATITMNVSAPMHLALPAFSDPNDPAHPYTVEFYSFGEGANPTAEPGAEPIVNPLAEPGAESTPSPTPEPSPSPSPAPSPSSRPNPEIELADAQDNINGGKGTLFAVVAQRIGSPESSQTSLTSWAPLSGTSRLGYDVHECETDAQLKQTVIDIAKAAETDNEAETLSMVFRMGPSGAMELDVSNLPGHIYDYYYMLPEGQRDKARFTLLYYWTEANSLAGAEVSNTWRVDSGLEAPYAFDRTFGSIIEVPNMGNRLIVQKYDVDKTPTANGPQTLINEAVFGLFPANEDGTFKAKNADGTETSVLRSDIESEKYRLELNFDAHSDKNSYAKLILNQQTEDTSDDVIIEAIEVRRTSSLFLEGSDGTTAFGIREELLPPGCYYLLEVEAPPGYERNKNAVMVMVTEDAIYANAGIAPKYEHNEDGTIKLVDGKPILIEDDHIRTARGVGYITSTLHKAASDGDVNRTLTWIYHRLAISNEESTSFDDAIPFGEGAETWHYLNENDLKAWYPLMNVGTQGRTLTSYLIYDRTPQHLGATDKFLANYKPDTNPKRLEHLQEDELHAGEVNTHTLPIATEAGWSFNEIYQAYDWGVLWLNDAENSEYQMRTRYEDLHGKNIYNLFSRAIYVRVGDKRLYGDLEVSKKVLGTNIDPNKDFTFTVYVEDLEDFKSEYDYFIYDADVGLPANATPTGKYSGGQLTITLKHNQVLVIKNLPGGLNYEVAETPLVGYKTTYQIDAEDAVVGYRATGKLHCRIMEGDRYVSKVAFTNDMGTTTDITITKNAYGSETLHLNGAKFVFMMNIWDETYYYHAFNVTDTEGNVETKHEWVTLGENQKPEDFALTTDENGVISITGIQDGEYILRELAPPEGYMPLNKDIRFKITNGAITELTVGGSATSEYVSKKSDTSLTIYNVGGTELPATGGTGITRYITGGTLLCACAGILLLYIKRKHRMEDSVSP